MKLLTRRSATVPMLVLAFALSPAALAGDHFFGTSAGSWGKLKTKVLPVEASVWIDGMYVGHADQFNGPGQELYLPAGEHEVVLSLVYYDDIKTKVNIEANRTALIEQQMTRSDERVPTGPFEWVKIKCSDFDRAAVIVNGRFMGHVDDMNGPGQWLLLEPGTYKIEVKQAGYQTFETTLQAEAGARRDIKVTLTKDGSAVYSYK